MLKPFNAYLGNVSAGENIVKKVVWTKTLIASTILASLAVAPVALADCRTGDCWGAVAYGPGAWATALNHRSRDDASAVAKAECHGRCTNTLTFHNECGAYATGTSGMGWGASKNKDTAIGRAINECNSVTRNCQVRVWGCTTR
jgi:uncharacterized protein DUF4189